MYYFLRFVSKHNQLRLLRWKANSITVSGNTVYDINTEQFPGWENGGLKVIALDLLLVNTLVFISCFKDHRVSECEHCEQYLVKHALPSCVD